jgi:hypothetical protein
MSQKESKIKLESYVLGIIQEESLVNLGVFVRAAPFSLAMGLGVQ